MFTICLAVACALLVATALTFALRARHWRRQADKYKIAFGAASGAAARTRGAVEQLAERLRTHSDHGLSPDVAEMFADKFEHAARWGEVQ
ncbi:hypothetical protein BJF85_02800 [Saccharomonospora sp. CUA-673]|uniref:hypothetical protein n=1 Tax=Saccharomonospora sp. CUA-673 TaxID=1904969 RepID=UPI00095A8CE5|nr:hypothetical protein [Saccharomonospora sp. CUA-673]OLT43048.1 hypothetical protein BJF85_02800 [Saccharomonospora sp. CUA-673]